MTRNDPCSRTLLLHDTGMSPKKTPVFHYEIKKKKKKEKKTLVNQNESFVGQDDHTFIKCKTITFSASFLAP